MFTTNKEPWQTERHQSCPPVCPDHKFPISRPSPPRVMAPTSGSNVLTWNCEYHGRPGDVLIGRSGGRGRGSPQWDINMIMQKLNCLSQMLGTASLQSPDDILILLIVVSSHKALMNVFENRNCNAGECCGGNGEERIMGLIWFVSNTYGCWGRSVFIDLAKLHASPAGD